ncbi:hypothetical protein BDA96_02G218300 [Sorghum bicolor]|uniref:EamA domain-containing protein n=3 Tax=Sorghum bicolor TaxID=4558 RepID=A0A1B6QCL5_SORBI|nr:hypothetical protein BDA96_02G218300 [Sorghum bicolor]KXG35662.1 hypothetical protein SORBI_3002G207500 [Sorghum bicolor]
MATTDEDSSIARSCNSSSSNSSSPFSVPRSQLRRARRSTHSSAWPNMAGGGTRAGAEGYNYKPCVAMVTTQCIFAAMTLWVKAAFGRGMSPMVFVVYRQAVATLVLAPIAIIANRARLKEMRVGMRMKAFLLVFLAALFGATANQNLCYQGLHLGTSSLATTMTNLIPAITFVMAVAVGQERVNIREVSSTAKILGTAVCVGGAITIAFFKGPKLPMQFLSDPSMILHKFSSDNWVMGALFLVGSSSCWSLWLILQGPICQRYMDPLCLSAWTCFLSTLQSAVVAFFLLPDRSAWRIHSLFELSCYAFAGVFGSGAVFYLQSWCISVRGPLYSAMFTPLCTVLTTALSAAILHEQLHVGSLVGAAAVIAGLYIVLWGKAEDARTGRIPPALRRKDCAKAAAADVEVEPHLHSHSQLDLENTLAAPLVAGQGACTSTQLIHGTE